MVEPSLDLPPIFKEIRLCSKRCFTILRSSLGIVAVRLQKPENDS